MEITESKTERHMKGSDCDSCWKQTAVTVLNTKQKETIKVAVVYLKHETLSTVVDGETMELDKMSISDESGME